MSIILGKYVALSCLHDGSYKKLGGMQLTEMTLDSTFNRKNAVDDDMWQKLINAPTARSMTIAGNGIFYSDRIETIIANYAYEGRIIHMKLSLHNSKEIEADFAIGSYSFQSTAREPLAFGLTLQSAGAVMFS